MSGQTISQAGAGGKLVGRDFITLAIFGLLLFVVFFIFAMVLGMNANVFWYTHAIGAIPGGIVWMYVLAKVNKRGAIAIMGAIIAVVGLLLGMFWAGPAGIFIGAVAAEFIAGVGKSRTTARCIAAFAVFTVCFWVGQQTMIFLAGDAYVDMVVASGMTAEYGQTLVDFTKSPMLIVALAGTVVGPIVGGLFGAKLFKKHFAKIAA